MADMWEQKADVERRLEKTGKRIVFAGWKRDREVKSTEL
jgi:phage terminase large subunit